MAAFRQAQDLSLEEGSSQAVVELLNRVRSLEPDETQEDDGEPFGDKMSGWQASLKNSSQNLLSLKRPSEKPCRPGVSCEARGVAGRCPLAPRLVTGRGARPS
jgi:hypothetical protein